MKEKIAVDFTKTKNFYSPKKEKKWYSLILKNISAPKSLFKMETTIIFLKKTQFKKKYQQEIK